MLNLIAIPLILRTSVGPDPTRSMTAIFAVVALFGVATPTSGAEDPEKRCEGTAVQAAIDVNNRD